MRIIKVYHSEHDYHVKLYVWNDTLRHYVTMYSNTFPPLSFSRLFCSDDCVYLSQLQMLNVLSPGLGLVTAPRRKLITVSLPSRSIR